MQSYRAIIVEDSDEEAAVLERHLERYGTEHDLRFAVTCLKSALEFMAQAPRADLIFMDIDLPGITGMEAAEELRTRDSTTPLIFVTNLAQYAVRGYQVDALDFMVKPVGYHDFSMRMARAMRVIRRNEGRALAISTPDGVRVVAMRDIVYIDLIRHDLQYHVIGQDRALAMRGSIRRAEAELPSELFIRTSQGCLVNMAHIRTVRADAVETDDGTLLYFSRSRRKSCLEALARYLGGTV